jgi:hypothetical protein
MVSYLDALLGGYGSEQDYLRQDPFFGAGAQIATMQMPQASNDWEAILGPTLQGVLAGSLTGYGKKRANESAYDAYQGNSLLKALNPNIGPVASGDEYAGLMLHDYSRDDAPKGWTADVGKRDLLLQALQAQSQIEAAQKQAALQDEITKGLALKGLALTEEGVVPVPGYADAQGSIMGTEAGLKAKAEAAAKRQYGGLELPAAMNENLSKSSAVIDEARTLAGLLKSSGTTWSELQASKAFSGMDEEGLALTLSNLADRLSRARTGAAMGPREIELYNKLVGGDLTASPAQVANLLEKLAEAESRTIASQLKFTTKAQRSTPEELIGEFSKPTAPTAVPEVPEGAIPTGKTTKTGQPIYIVNGVEGVFE